MTCLCARRFRPLDYRALQPASLPSATTAPPSSISTFPCPLSARFQCSVSTTYHLYAPYQSPTPLGRHCERRPRELSSRRLQTFPLRPGIEIRSEASKPLPLTGAAFERTLTLLFRHLHASKLGLIAAKTQSQYSSVAVPSSTRSHVRYPFTSTSLSQHYTNTPLNFQFRLRQDGYCVVCRHPTVRICLCGPLHL